MRRHDYAFPFRIDAASRQGARAASYEAHVEQMIRQVLLTSPGERADLPAFGCGLRRLVFAPHAEPLAATAQVVVMGALQRWLGEHIDVRQVTVAPPDAPGEEGQLSIRIDYVLRGTLGSRSVEVTVQ
jgi:phage baseplate assembly protein W